VSEAVTFSPRGPLRGTVRVPSDKSITQRALLIGAVSDGVVEVRAPLWSGDTEATAAMLVQLGVRVERGVGGRVARVHGVGLRGLRPPAGVLDARNSGTAMRLLTGLLAGQRGTFTVDGDESLRRRPMARVAEPLRAMGVAVSTGEGGRPPLSITGGDVRPVTYELPVASAQVKSCVLLAGLFADGETCVIERAPSRDHTERMLATAGVDIRVEPAGSGNGAARGRREPAADHQDEEARRRSLREEAEDQALREEPPRRRRIVLRGPAQPRLRTVDVPGDPSSAAFLVAAAVTVPGSVLVIEDVGLNETRLAFFEVLRRMGATVTWCAERESGEPAGRLTASAAGRLAATTVSAGEVPLLVDELPLVALVAAFADGETVVEGAAELRVKESDRLAATVELLKALGADITGIDDGFTVRGGGGLHGGLVESHGDHRLALLGAVAGLAASAPVTVSGFDVAGVSFPGFHDLAWEVTSET
jgi:3-phosphoshikimate 1-carboxyvinyltransferase